MRRLFPKDLSSDEFFRITMPKINYTEHWREYLPRGKKLPKQKLPSRIDPRISLEEFPKQRPKRIYTKRHGKQYPKKLYFR